MVGVLMGGTLLEIEAGARGLVVLTGALTMDTARKFIVNCEPVGDTYDYFVRERTATATRVWNSGVM